MSPGSLPPVGQITTETQSLAVTYLQDLASESQASRDPWVNLAAINNEIYLWGDYPKPDCDKVVVNEIQNAINSDVTIQTREPPSAKLEPVETGDPGEIYSLVQASPPIDPAFVQVATQPQGVDPLSGAVIPGADPNSFIHVNDQLVSDVYQQVFDRYWKRSDTDAKVREIVRVTEVKGWTFSLYEFDEDQQRHRVRVLGASQAYVDPSYQSIGEAAYAGVDIVLDADEAKKFYPELGAAIDANKKTGSPLRFTGSGTLGQADRDYRRDVVTMRVFWLRNQPCPMSVEEAVAGGAVQQVEVADQTQAQPIQSAVSGVDGAEGVSPAVDNTEPAVPGQADTNSGFPEAQPQTRLALLHPDAGEEVTPDHPAWPTRLCIRQITALADTIVEDKECEHPDIPLLQSVNRPVLGEPWGIGEPMYLRNVQSARNRMLQGIVALCDFYKNPAGVLPQSVADAMIAVYGDAYIEPGRTLIFPDDMYEKLDPAKLFLTPPQLSPALVTAQDLLKNEINDQSGHTDALRGSMPSGDPSGRAIMALQDSGTSMIQHKSQGTADMIERMCRLMLHALVWRVPLPHIKKIVSKYPDWVLEAIIRRAQNIEWDVNVTVSSGSGQLIAQKKQEAMAQFQMRDATTGEPLRTIESTREVLNIDHQSESEKWRSQMAPILEQQAQAAQQEHEQGMERDASKGAGKQQGPPA